MPTKISICMRWWREIKASILCDREAHRTYRVYARTRDKNNKPCKILFRKKNVNKTKENAKNIFCKCWVSKFRKYKWHRFIFQMFFFFALPMCWSHGERKRAQPLQFNSLSFFLLFFCCYWINSWYSNFVVAFCLRFFCCVCHLDFCLSFFLLLFINSDFFLLLIFSRFFAELLFFYLL